MSNWGFKLNGEAMSALTCGASSFQAFSGLNTYKNKPASQCLAGYGPIPIGTYYILQRESGGKLGWLRDIWTLNDKKDWFALYAADGKVDDEMFCEQVKRGGFRLHPKGALGISEGCIVIEDKKDFITISRMLKNAAMMTVPGADIKAYGKLIVSR